LRTLGFRDVKIYEPSWLGYAGMLNAPAEDEVFVNVEALTKKIAALESEIKGLEEELARLKSQQQ
jgi:thiosulfate/3-mercaptopyruvate sulfurtransferase